MQTLTLLSTKEMIKKSGLTIPKFRRAMKLGLLTPDYQDVRHGLATAYWNPENRERFEALRPMTF